MTPSPGLRNRVVVCHNHVEEGRTEINLWEIFLSFNPHTIKFNFLLKSNLSLTINIFLA